jgi:hypothetical protein
VVCVRGGLDDALERLARRDRMRRRSGQQAGGPPPAVAELVEAIADVVGRNPEMTLTIGVKGAGSPVILHVAMEDGVVRVTAGDPPDATPTDAHLSYAVDFDYDAEEAAPPTGSHRYEPDGSGPEAHRYGAPATGEGGTVPSEREPAGPPYVPMASPPPPSPPAAAPVQPPPLARPVPLQVEQPEETELAARRLAALLREDPSLLG